VARGEKRPHQDRSSIQPGYKSLPGVLDSLYAWTMDTEINPRTFSCGFFVEF
jgi:hypothetical protein